MHEVIANIPSQKGRYWFHCPGCKGIHIFTTFESDAKIKWAFNEDLVRPSFHPSLKVFYADTNETVCHFFLKEGTIKFCNDSPHALSGKHVPLPPVRDYAGYDSMMSS